MCGRDGFDLKHELGRATSSQLKELCHGLKVRVERAVAVMATYDADVAENYDEDDIELREVACEDALACSIVARLLVDVMDDRGNVDLVDAACLLHDHGLLAASDCPSLQEEVMKLCLDCWEMQVDGKERLAPQAIPYLMISALESGTTASAKRCYAMKNALKLFDFSDEDTGDLKKLLLRVAFAPSFLRCGDGRKFIAFLFTIQPELNRNLAAIVKNQIPSGRKSVLDAYGDIVFRAWMTSEGSCQQELENFIQGLMNSSTLATTEALSSAIRRVLRGIHSQKIQSHVDKLLVKLYEPILYRRLHAPNAMVRRNAFALLAEVFPLRVRCYSNCSTMK